MFKKPASAGFLLSVRLFPGPPASVLGGVALHAGDVGFTVGHAARALAFKNHASQAFHGAVVRVVQRVDPVRQQFHCLADAPGLVNAGLLADGQVHREVQKRIGPVGVVVEHAGQRSIKIGQFGVVFGVLVDPLADQHFHGFERSRCAGFGVNAAKKAPDIGL